MLEYFTYKKYKKYKEEKEAKEEARPANNGQSQQSESSASRKGKAVLKPEDETFLAELLSQHGDDETPPPLPPRVYDFELDSASENEAGPSTSAKKPNRLSILFARHKSPSPSAQPQQQQQQQVTPTVTPAEAEREKMDVRRVLNRLSLSAVGNTVVAYSKESSELLPKFTQIFKDLVNGVPTAYDDLTKFIEDRDGAIARVFDKLPSSMKKLVTQLPEKLTGSLAPEILAAAAEVQGLKTDGAKATAKKMLTPSNLTDLVTKPGAVVGMLKAIVNVLKTRWPAFMGMNVIWSVALSLLLVVLWYCYKRGREERLIREKAGVDADQQPETLTGDQPDGVEGNVPATAVTTAQDTDLAGPSGSGPAATGSDGSSNVKTADKIKDE